MQKAVIREACPPDPVPVNPSARPICCEISKRLLIRPVLVRVGPYLPNAEDEAPCLALALALRRRTIQSERGGASAQLRKGGERGRAAMNLAQIHLSPSRTPGTDRPAYWIEIGRVFQLYKQVRLRLGRWIVPCLFVFPGLQAGAVAR